LYTLDELKTNRDLWRGIHIIPAKCEWCESEFEIKYGTLYNIIRRNAEGIYCSRKCAGSARAYSTQEKYRTEGGKNCKRCGEFKALDNFSTLPNPPFFRAECKRCHNYKPARQFGSYKDKAQRLGQDFEISLDNFLVICDRPCFYCNSEVRNVRLEMIDYSQGYKLQNIVSCCRRCQKFKDGLSHQKFLELCFKISENVKDNEVK